MHPPRETIEPHIHALAMDGCFEAVGEDDVRFLSLPQLSPSHLVCVLDRLHGDLAEHLEDEGVPPDEAVAACVQLLGEDSSESQLVPGSGYGRRDSPI